MLSFILGHAIAASFKGRYDGNPKLRYFEAADFSCNSRPFCFYSGKNLLRGEMIYDGELSSKKDVILFFHGAGAGRAAYMKEMCYLAKKGFMIYCYDKTGCMQSEGTNLIDLAHSINDVDAFFDYLKNDPYIGGKNVYAVGHSWGGFDVKYCLGKDLVSRCVSLAGVVDLPSLYVKQGHLPSWMKGSIASYLRRRFGKGAVEGFDTLKNATKPFFYIVGDHDDFINYYDEIVEISLQNPNILTKLVHSRGHQCYWSKEASMYFYSTMKNGFGALNDNPAIQLDYDRLNVDEKLMEEIVDFLRR